MKRIEILKVSFLYSTASSGPGSTHSFCLFPFVSNIQNKANSRASEAGVYSLVIVEFQKLASAIQDFCVACEMKTHKLPVRLERFFNITMHGKKVGLLDTCELSVPFAIRNSKKLSTLSELHSYMEECFINPNTVREIVCSDTVTICVSRYGHRNGEMMSY